MSLCSNGSFLSIESHTRIRNSLGMTREVTCRSFSCEDWDRKARPGLLTVDLELVIHPNRTLNQGG